jgi:hypothetical protein
MLFIQPLSLNVTECLSIKVTNTWLYILDLNWETVFPQPLEIQGMFKKRPNFCYKDFVAHFTAF